jgi:hypothetical protein
MKTGEGLGRDGSTPDPCVLHDPLELPLFLPILGVLEAIRKGSNR